MPKIEAKILKGFRDYLPEDMIPKQEMMFKIKTVFERYGFSPLETPALEYQETLLGKYGDEGSKQLFKFEDNGKRKVGMRFDLTVPLARVVAMYQNDIPLPFKRYQIQNVWRAEKPQKGRYREFYQCDVDCVGSKNILADTEFVSIAKDIMTELGIDKYLVRINNRKLLNGFFEQEKIKESEVNKVIAAIDKLLKIGEEGVTEELKKIGLAKEQIENTLDFIKITGKNLEIIDKLEAKNLNSAQGKEGVAELRQMFEYLESVGIDEKICKLDLTLARGLEYYTGTVYETVIVGAENIGSVIGGGRYDELVGMFLGKKIPAVGYSVGLDRLYAALVELKLLVTNKKTTARVLVTVFEEDLSINSMKVAEKLRKAGINTELYTGSGNLKKQFKYADKMGIEYVVVIGSDEIENNKATLKNLKKQSQITVAIDQLVNEIK